MTVMNRHYAGLSGSSGKKCGVYARYSSESQHPASIEDQLLACQRCAEQHGWTINEGNIYKDAALSGMGVQHRPEYRRLLDAVASPSRPFDILLVDDLSRLSRDAAETLRLVQVLQHEGIKLISVADGIETGNKNSKLAFSLKAIMNDCYLDDLRDRTLRGLQGRFFRGLHTGGRIYGYRSAPVLDPNGRLDSAGKPLQLGAELLIASEEAEVVRRIFTWFGDGLSLRAIACRLNAEGVSFPGQPAQRGLKRKGWALSAVRVILKNEKYIGRWVWMRRIFSKDPMTGRRRARLRPTEEWQVSEFPDLRIVSDQLSQKVQARFQALAALYPGRQAGGRLRGRNPGAPSSRGSLFSGLLQCGLCGGGLVIANGSIERGNRRYGCGFRRNKGPQICTNALTVKESIVEARLVSAIRSKVLHPEALSYLVRAVNQRLQHMGANQDGERRRIETELQEVDQKLRNIERAILSGMVGQTTARLLEGYEARRKELAERLARYESRDAAGTQPLDAESVRRVLENLQTLLAGDAVRVNAFFREHLTPIVCTPVEENGQRFYRARGAAHGAELLKTLGLGREFDFGGCGGRIWPPAPRPRCRSLAERPLPPSRRRSAASIPFQPF